MFIEFLVHDLCISVKRWFVKTDLEFNLISAVHRWFIIYKQIDSHSLWEVLNQQAVNSIAKSRFMCGLGTSNF